MFVIVTYDVNKKRDGKVLKICRKYLSNVQKSVCEGAITQSKLMKLKNELSAVIDYDEDAICIYSFENTIGLQKDQIGVNHVTSSII